MPFPGIPTFTVITAFILSKNYYDFVSGCYFVESIYLSMTFRVNVLLCPQIYLECICQRCLEYVQKHCPKNKPPLQQTPYVLPGLHSLCESMCAVHLSACAARFRRFSLRTTTNTHNTDSRKKHTQKRKHIDIAHRHPHAHTHTQTRI